jgi:hypothetical protein
LYFFCVIFIKLPGIDSAFAHKGGVHVSAVQRNPMTYEHIAPEKVGNINLTCNNFDIVEEILFKIHLLHNRKTQIIEIPDHFYNRDLGVTKRKLGPFIITYIFTLVRLRFRVK